MSTPDTGSIRGNWRRFCKEDPLTVEEAIAWREMADAFPNEDLLDFIVNATKDEEAAFREVELCGTRDYPNLVKRHDASRRYERAELAAWARWQEQEQEETQ